MGYQDDFIIDDRERGIFRVNRELMTSRQVYDDERRA